MGNAYLEGEALQKQTSQSDSLNSIQKLSHSSIFETEVEHKKEVSTKEQPPVQLKTLKQPKRSQQMQRVVPQSRQQAEQKNGVQSKRYQSDFFKKKNCRVTIDLCGQQDIPQSEPIKAEQIEKPISKPVSIQISESIKQLVEEGLLPKDEAEYPFDEQEERLQLLQNLMDEEDLVDRQVMGQKQESFSNASRPFEASSSDSFDHQKDIQDRIFPKKEFLPERVIYWNSDKLNLSSVVLSSDQEILENLKKGVIAQGLQEKCLVGTFTVCEAQPKISFQKGAISQELLKELRVEIRQETVENSTETSPLEANLEGIMENRSPEAVWKIYYLIGDKQICSSEKIASLSGMVLRNKQSKSAEFLSALSFLLKHGVIQVKIFSGKIEDKQNLMMEEKNECQILEASFDHEVYFDPYQYNFQISQIYRENTENAEEKASDYMWQACRLLKTVLGKLSKASAAHQQNSEPWNLNGLGEEQALKIEKSGDFQRQSAASKSLRVEELFESGNYFSLSRQEITPWEPSSLFEGELTKPQQLALPWMLYREGCQEISMKSYRVQNHHKWECIFKGGLGSTSLYVNSETKQILNFVPELIKRCKGGILADEMGLGKTISSIALMTTHLLGSEALNNRRALKGAANLVVMPLGLLKQWQRAIKLHAPSFGVFIAHDRKLTEEEVQRADVVLTTYGYLGSHFSKSKNYDFEVTLFDFSWFRVFMDEAHQMRNIESKGCKAALKLTSQYKWLLTGTPIHNRVNDLEAYFQILEYRPWNCAKSLAPFLNEGFPKSQKKLSQLREVMRRVLVRRKKNQIGEDGYRILDLRDYQIEQIRVGLTAEERSQYKKFCFKVLSKIIDVLDGEDGQWSISRPTKQRGREYRFNEKVEDAFSQMMKMRQFCCHPLLATSKSNYIRFQSFYKCFAYFLKHRTVKKRAFRVSISEQDFLESLKHNSRFNRCKDSELALEVYLRIMARRKFECELCKQNAVNPLLAVCLHVYCEACFKDYWRKPVNQKHEMIDSGSNSGTVKSKKKYVECACELCSEKLYFREQLEFPRINCFDKELSEIEPNDKIERLLWEVTELRGEKSVVFSNFLGMIQILEEMFRRFDVSYLVMSGQDTYQERTQKVEQFATGSQQVFLISLKAGYSGLNLQMASRMFFMDPWWNPAIEDQAVGRIHRLGQLRDVKVTRFITSDTLEESMAVMNQEKRLLYDLALDSASKKKRSQKVKRLMRLKEELLRSLQKSAD